MNCYSGPNSAGGLLFFCLNSHQQALWIPPVHKRSATLYILGGTMGQYYDQLSLEERCTITCLRKQGESIRQIAATMARSPSSISREIKRNISKSKGYDPNYAHLQTKGRRWRGSRLERDPALRKSVLDCLTMGHSPQIIAGRLARDQGCNVISHESIYRFIYGQLRRTNDHSWRQYLPRRKSKRGIRGRRGGSPASHMKDIVSIHKRPSYVLKRASIGHWEADLMSFSKYGQHILVVHERYTRFTLLYKLPNKEAKTVIKVLLNISNGLPRKFFRTITFDNGTEFAEHYRLNEIDRKTYFCDVKSPWQKGGIENSIGRLRRFLPRKTDLADVSDKDIEALSVLYNSTPRVCLNYETPAEIFHKQLLHLKSEFIFPPTRE